MKALKNLFILLLIISFAILNTGCKKETSVEPEIDEVQVLLEYLETDNYINTTACPSVINAEDVYAYVQNNPTKIYIMDVRDSATFVTKGRIRGAFRVDYAKAIDHIMGLPNWQNYDRIVVVCYSGQSSGYIVSFLRMLGYNNVWSLKYGMSSWNEVFAQGYWLGATGNPRAGQFTTVPASKNPAGALPTFEKTGKKTGKEILIERAKKLVAQGYTPARITHSDVFTNLNNYYIVDYRPADHYNQGHIPGSVQYTPRSDLKSTTHLKTLPINKPIVVYCYTGQTSAHIVAFLRALGYDARSLLYGTNAMIYDTMPGTKFVPANDIKNYPYVTGP